MYKKLIISVILFFSSISITVADGLQTEGNETFKLDRVIAEKANIIQFFGKPLFLGGRNIYKQYGYKGHEGIDFSLSTGTELLASIEGTISIHNDGKKGNGLSITISKDTGEGYMKIIYSHLSKTIVEDGSYIKVGEIIGLSGGDRKSPTSGMSTGPHLHFGVKYTDYEGNEFNEGNGYKGYIDPINLFKDGTLN